LTAARIRASRRSDRGARSLLVDSSANLADFNPVLITGGNLQLHISSCDNPPLEP